jgi:hypothetical protein
MTEVIDCPDAINELRGVVELPLKFTVQVVLALAV